MKKKAIVMFALAAMLIAPLAFAADKGPGAPNAEKLGWRLGCQAYSFNKFTFFDAVDKTESLGLKWIEAYPGQKLCAEKPELKFDENMSDEAMAMAKDKLKKAGITLVNYGVVGLSTDEAKDRKVFDFAKKMGIETIVSEPVPAAFPLLDKLTKEYGIKVAIHNHPKPSFYWDFKKEADALKGASDRIGACADTGHWVRSGLVSLDGLKALKGRIVSLHFKDLNENSKDAHDVPWGTGVCNVKEMLAELKAQGFKGVFSIEYEHNWDNSVPDIAQCVANFDKMAAELAK
jgi:sugar phosphate isomerase/epimerase